MATETLDPDDDGLLSLEDLMALMERVKEDEKMKDMREAFNLYDTEATGFITPKTLRSLRLI